MSSSDAISGLQHYSDPADFLQQGDVFKGPIVGPISDSEQRIFRSADGQHGSVVFGGGGIGKVFSPNLLSQHLATVTVRTPLHTEPFSPTPDGQREFVVTNADLIRYIVVVSQTCDVCGLDKPAHPLAMVLTAKSFEQLAKTELLPFPGESAKCSIHDYLCRQSGFEDLPDAVESSYADTLKTRIKAWKPATNDGKACRGLVSNFFAKLMKSEGPVYYLAADASRGIPPLYVDFIAAFAVTNRQLQLLKQNRVATLSESYRNHFAQAFANHVGRIALPIPMRTANPLD